MKYLIFIIGFCCFLCAPALACQCMPPTPEISQENLKNSAFVFDGEIIAVETLSSSSLIKTKLKINKSYKNLFPAQQIEAYFGITETCDIYTVGVGERDRYVLYQIEHEGKNIFVAAGLCGSYIRDEDLKNLK